MQLFNFFKEVKYYYKTLMIITGIAVSNHLSPNDIQIIHANVEMNADFGFTVTGQKHSGIIWAIERLTERICCALWFERNNAEERKRFTDILIKEGRVSDLLSMIISLRVSFIQIFVFLKHKI